MNKWINTNRAVMAGTVVTEPTRYDCSSTSFMSFILAISRLSGNKDYITVNCPIGIGHGVKIGDKVMFIGQIRTYNREVDGKRRLIIVFYPQSTQPYKYDVNDVELSGSICRTPIYRTTLSDKSICDFMVAVNRYRRKSDYIPCIAWGGYAMYTADLDIGDKVMCKGRLQSREYTKITIDDNGQTTEITRTIHEVSLNEIYAVTDAQGE